MAWRGLLFQGGDSMRLHLQAEFVGLGRTTHGLSSSVSQLGRNLTIQDEDSSIQWPVEYYAVGEIWTTMAYEF